MKKISKLFLLLVIWVLYLWVSFADLRYHPSEISVNIPTVEPWIAIGSDISNVCDCAYSPEVLYFATKCINICIITILIASLLIFPLRKVFQKAWQKWRYSLIPWRNLYVLFKISSHVIFRIIFLWICFLILFFFLFWDNIQWSAFERSGGCCAHLPGINALLWISLISFILILLFQVYSLARKFGWKIFTSILFALFFPIWVRILAFGNYEYIWDNKSSKILESK